ncbi:hypothetical protein AB0M20_34720 [Actinoplanes sp. NPDC051633]|uniref:TolB family protein n=1 Tax=Actinoplanes sp. NPDC051633 TaxID=3155670 RepID=UPI0034252A42
MKLRLLSTVIIAAAVVLGVAVPAQAAARPGGVLLVTDAWSTHALDVRTGARLSEVGNGSDATISARGRWAYAHDVDECIPDIEGCWGAPDLVTSGPAGGAERVLVHNPERSGGATDPAWSPDGRRLVYSWHTPGERGLNMINADGTGNEQIVSFSGPGRFSPDGRGVAFVKDGNVQVIDLRTRAVRVLTTDGDALYDAPDWSPDGRRLVYAAADSFRIVPATGGPSTGPTCPASRTR